MPGVLFFKLTQQSDGLVRHDIFPQQLYNHILHTVISHHIVPQLSPLISIVGQDSGQSLVYKDGFHHSFRRRQFECLMPSASSEDIYHNDLRHRICYYDIILMETPPEFSFPIFLAYSIEHAYKLYLTITLKKRLNWYPWVSTG